jgi:hypothetical protein
LKSAGDNGGPGPIDRLIMPRKLTSVLSAALAATLAFGAQAQPARLQVATWNLAWLMGRATFDQWRTFCAANGWNPGPGVEPAVPLPVCDAHSGMTFPLPPCLRAKDPAHAAHPPASFPPDHPCRESLELRTWSRYNRKLVQLRATANRLKTQGVQAVFFQEAYDARAAAEVFTPAQGWRVVTSAELPGAVAIAQQVGIAVRSSVRIVGTPRLVGDLAVETAAGRSVRPGLEVTLQFGADEIDFLVVHLKSGCRSDVIDAPVLRRRTDETDTEFNARVAAKQEGCGTLRRQIPALEAWIDGKAAAGRLYMVVGDFNRTLLRDGFDPSRARLPGSDSTDARQPITPATRIARLTPELNDGDPAGATLFIARADYGPLGDTEACKAATQGIDHFVLGVRLSDEVGGLDHLAATVTGYGPAAHGKTVALPSDHCPHALRLQLAP